MLWGDTMNNETVVLKTINETKDKILSFRNELIYKGKQIPDMKSISRSLLGVEKTINDIKILCNDENKSLDCIVENLNYAQSKELLGMTVTMFDVINANLLNGMKLEDDGDLTEEDLQKSKIIKYNNNTIGKVNILDENGSRLYIQVKVYNFIDKFEVDNPYRMYHIISFINTKFNYE